MTEPATPRRWFGRGRTRALLAAGLLVGTGAVATSAYWTSKRTITGTTITAGAMHVDLASNVRIKPETYTWSALDLTGTTPGTTRAATIQVKNNSTGRLPFSYRIQAAASGGLASALTVKVRNGGSVAGSGNATTCTGGTALGSAAMSGTLDVAAGGPSANLAVGQSATICVEVDVAGTGLTSSSWNSPTTLTFTFPAKQVAP